MKQKDKTLGQIAYEATPDEGGMANFGPWENLTGPVGDLIKRIHERMASKVAKEVERRRKMAAKR